MTALDRTKRRMARYVGYGDLCARDGYMASAIAHWRRAGASYALALRLSEIYERSRARARVRRRGYSQ